MTGNSTEQYSAELPFICACALCRLRQRAEADGGSTELFSEASSKQQYPAGKGDGKPDPGASEIPFLSGSPREALPVSFSFLLRLQRAVAGAG